MNPFTAMSDDEFVERFRLQKQSTLDLIEEIKDQLPAAIDSRGMFLSTIFYNVLLKILFFSFMN